MNYIFSISIYSISIYHIVIILALWTRLLLLYLYITSICCKKSTEYLQRFPKPAAQVSWVLRQPPKHAQPCHARLMPRLNLRRCRAQKSSMRSCWTRQICCFKSVPFTIITNLQVMILCPSYTLIHIYVSFWHLSSILVAHVEEFVKINATWALQNVARKIKNH